MTSQARKPGPTVVIPGCAAWRRPGIHTHDRGYGFRALVSLAPERRKGKSPVV
jgi:hypothetical protein